MWSILIKNAKSGKSTEKDSYGYSKNCLVHWSSNLLVLELQPELGCQEKASTQKKNDLEEHRFLITTWW